MIIIISLDDSNNSTFSKFPETDIKIQSIYAVCLVVGHPPLRGEGLGINIYFCKS